MYNKNIDIIITIIFCITCILPILWPTYVESRHDDNILLQENRYISLLDSKEKMIKLLETEIKIKNKIINTLEKTRDIKNEKVDKNKIIVDENNNK